MHILVVGLNHRCAPIELRERLAFRQEQLPHVFARLRSDIGLPEAAVLSTCNRVEIYAATASLAGAFDRLQRFLGDHGQMDPSGLTARLYTCAEPQSVHHLFSVASGLDSMVLGEGEILKQVKCAYELARHCGATGKLLNVLFQRALNTAKTVRAQTGISQGCMSLGAVAVDVAQKIFDPLSDSVVLLVGTGKIGEVTLKYLASRGVRDVRILNRSAEKARMLSMAYRATAVSFESFPQQLVEVDIVITSTSSPIFLLSRMDVEAAMRRRHNRPLCLVDLGVPRNIEPSAGDLENVYRFDIDDFQHVVNHTYQQRQKAVEHSKRIIDEKVDRFLSWWHEEQGCATLPSAHAAAR